MLRLYTDGSYSDETGVGGWAWLLVGDETRELGSGSVEQSSTHQRMELVAAVEGLAAVPEGAAVELVSDSTYVVDALRLGYLERWRGRGWRKVSHLELWRGFAELTDRRSVLGTWVPRAQRRQRRPVQRDGRPPGEDRTPGGRGAGRLSVLRLLVG